MYGKGQKESLFEKKSFITYYVLQKQQSHLSYQTDIKRKDRAKGKKKKCVQKT